MINTKKENKFRGFSPQASYTDWAIAPGRRILFPTFVDRGMSRSQRDRPLPPLISIF
jgi:hypothetical protein